MSRDDPASLDDPAFFVHRPWIESQLQEWLASETESPVAILTGPPGTGKSRYAYWLSEQLPAFKPDGTRPMLGVAILRDQRMSRPPDNFSWAALRNALLRLAGNNTIPGVTLNINVQTRNVDHGSTVIGASNIRLTQTTPESVSELQTVVIPALEQLPPGPPIVVIIDSLDEAGRLGAEDCLKAVNHLARRVAECRREDHGIGRLRVLLASQSKIPVELSGLRRPVLIDFAEPGPGDTASLKEHAAAVLEALPADNRAQIAALAAEQAGKIWLIASDYARMTNKDVTEGKPVPVTVRLPRDLRDWWQDTRERIKTRAESRWPEVKSLLELVAAAQEIGATLPGDVASAVLDVPDGEFEQILRCAEGAITGGHGDLRFFHLNFAWWIVDGGLGANAIAQAHDRLAQTLLYASSQDWTAASEYALAAVSSHALCAAEYGAGRTRPGRPLRERCMELLTDRDRLAVDQDPWTWIEHIDRLAALYPAGTCLAGADERLSGLAERLRAELEYAVGIGLGRNVADEVLTSFFRALEDPTALALVVTYFPLYEVTYREQFRRVFGRVLDGRTLCADLDAPWALSNFQVSEYVRTGDAALLDEAVSNTERAMRIATPDDSRWTGLLVALSGNLGLRAGANAARPDDLERAIGILVEVADRDDLPGFPWGLALLGELLWRRWETDPAGHPDDLAACIAAYRRAVDAAPAGHPQLTRLIIGLADALLSRFHRSGMEQPEILDDVIAVHRQLVARPDLHDPAKAWFRLAYLLAQRMPSGTEPRAEDLNGCIDAYRSALRYATDNYPDRTQILLGLSHVLVASAHSQPGILDDAIDVLRALVARSDLQHASRVQLMLARSLAYRWSTDPQERADDLTAACRAALESSADDTERTQILVQLTNEMSARFNAGQEREGDLDVTIAMAYQVVESPGQGNPAQWVRLAMLLQERRRCQDVPLSNELFAVIAAWRGALNATSGDHPLRTQILGELAGALIERLDGHARQSDDLDCAITACQEIVTRPDFEDKPQAKFALAALMRRRSREEPRTHAGELNDAIKLLRQALDVAPDDHLSLLTMRIQLANALFDGWLNKIAGIALSEPVALAAEILASDNAEAAANSLTPTLRRKARVCAASG